MVLKSHSYTVQGEYSAHKTIDLKNTAAEGGRGGVVENPLPYLALRGGGVAQRHSKSDERTPIKYLNIILMFTPQEFVPDGHRIPGTASCQVPNKTPPWKETATD